MNVSWVVVSEREYFWSQLLGNEKKTNRESRWSTIFFLILVNFTTCNFDTGSKKYTNVTGANMLSTFYPFCRAIKLQLCYWWTTCAISWTTATFTLLFLKMSVMMVTHYCYLKKSKWGTWTCSIILLNVSIMSVLISKYKKRQANILQQHYCIS